MRRTPFIVAAAITCSLSMSTAFATPPTGDAKFKDLARGQAADGGSIHMKMGTALASGSYSIAPGGETGWRELPGTMVLAVTKGKMMIHGGEGCSGKEYSAGQASVTPAGTWSVHNQGSEPLEFFGMFFDQPAGAPKPLVEGEAAALPSSCTGVLASAAPGGVSVVEPAVGTMVPGAYGHGQHGMVDVQSGKDVYASWLELAPGWSSGWISHRPAVNIVEKGTLGYVEARNGKCDESESYSAGEAFFHPPHRHIAYTKGSEPVVLWSMYFNLPHEPAAPVVGNTITAVDFSQAPPADCLRLR